LVESEAQARIRPDRGSILTVGFGMTVALWALGYMGRLPAVLLPSQILLIGLLVTIVAAGAFLGRWTGWGWRAGAKAGALCGLLNLLVLGSFLTEGQPNRLSPSAWIWIPGSIAVSAVLGAAGAELGSRFSRGGEGSRAEPDWVAAFARVTVVATLLLLAVGGLVTSTNAGLAVVDWPNSFGYNMFLYPFSRMTGPVYYEHAHRLFGALVGVTTLVLALILQRTDSRPWVRRLGWLSVGLVVVQGLLGGLRVTGRFTLSTAPDLMTPSTGLAMLHGVLGQLFFATVVALAVFSSRRWREAGEPLVRPGARTDRVLSTLLVGLVIGQLLLGAAQRHLHELLIPHMVVGVAFVTPLVIHVGLRAWGLNTGCPALQRGGLALVLGITAQLVLGLGAFALKAAAPVVGPAAVWDVTLSTAHQWCGALILALAVAVACWSFRLLAPEPPAGEVQRVTP
jgi:cytochrome c oxidase assembly protein subunit 15